MKRIRNLRELQAAPDDLLCTDPELAAKHKLKIPFWVTRIYWKGQGVVNVEFRSNHEHYRPIGNYDYGTTDYTSVRHLLVPDAPAAPGDVPAAGPSWESSSQIVNKLLESEEDDARDLLRDTPIEPAALWEPKGLSTLGQKAHAAIVQFLKEKDLVPRGEDKIFYSPSEWRARGESYGLGSELIVVHAYAFDWDRGCPYPSIEALSDRLKGVGAYTEQCTGWYSAIYRA